MFSGLKTIAQLKKNIKELETKVEKLEKEIKKEKSRNEMLYKLAQGFDKAREEGK